MSSVAKAIVAGTQRAHDRVKKQPTKGITEDDLENEKTESYELGIWSGIDGLSDEFSRRSGEAFAVRNDSEAQFYRRLSDEFKERAKEMRKAWDEKYPK